MNQRIRPGKYRAILADPGWHFATYSPKGQGKSASQHYDTTPLGGLKRLRVNGTRVRDLAAADGCVLFLWVVDCMLPEALELIAAWGFTFKAVAFTWVKHNWLTGKYPMGTGYRTRANPEMCLLAAKEAPKRLDRGVRQLIVARRRERSRKPPPRRGSGSSGWSAARTSNCLPAIADRVGIAGVMRRANLTRRHNRLRAETRSPAVPGNFDTANRLIGLNSETEIRHLC
jgi:N6-adenosine-specific RNA methylase IME4